MSLLDQQKRRTKYAWAQYFRVLTQQHSTNFSQYRRHRTIMTEIPSHLETVFREMYEESRKRVQCCIWLDRIEP